MPVINKGTALSNGEQLTAEKLNDLLDLATFSQTATDGVSTFVNSSGQIAVLDGGIAATKLATNAVSTTKILNANVTKAKLENMSAPLKVLGRTTAGAGAVEEVSILDEDDLVSNSAIALATQQSIKAYVDSNGITQTTGTAPYYGCRAWAFYNQVTDTVEASGNIASIVRTATGYSTVTFTEPMPSAFYAISITGSGNVNVQHTVGFINGTPTASGFGIAFFNTNNSANVANNNMVGITVFA
jgi:hypothetical protein